MGKYLDEWRKAERALKMKRFRQQKGKADTSYCVDYIPLICPQCGSKKVPAYKSELPVRYHKCKDCEFNFKSVEAPQEPVAK